MDAIIKTAFWWEVINIRIKDNEVVGDKAICLSRNDNAFPRNNIHWPVDAMVEYIPLPAHADSYHRYDHKTTI